MIDRELLNRIEHPNPSVRLDAVKQLARIGTQEALPYLAAIYKHDDDAEVRELARLARLYIQKKARQASVSDAVAEDAPAAKLAEQLPHRLKFAAGHQGKRKRKPKNDDESAAKIAFRDLPLYFMVGVVLVVVGILVLLAILVMPVLSLLLVSGLSRLLFSALGGF